MTPFECLREIANRKINLVSSLALWHASVDETGDTITTKRRKIRSISAIAPTPLDAVSELIRKLDSEAREQELFEMEDVEPW